MTGAGERSQAPAGDPRGSGAESGRRRPESGDGLAALTGAGSSVVGVEGAMRARDVSRPSAATLAEAATLPVRRASTLPGEG